MDTHHGIGEAIKALRLRNDLTQEQLGKRAGIHRTLVSRMERNNLNVSFFAVLRVFHALGVKSATLDLGSAGRLVLW